MKPGIIFKALGFRALWASAWPARVFPVTLLSRPPRPLIEILPDRAGGLPDPKSARGLDALRDAARTRPRPERAKSSGVRLPSAAFTDQPLTSPDLPVPPQRQRRDIVADHAPIKQLFQLRQRHIPLGPPDDVAPTELPNHLLNTGSTNISPRPGLGTNRRRRPASAGGAT